MVTLHGGCFVGGSHLWDQKQTFCLQKLGYQVHQLDFPKDNFEDTIDFIHKTLLQLVKSNEGNKLHLLGRSSGGYLAKVLFDKYPDLIKKAIYLAPVFDPITRGKINTKFQTKQSHYFRNTVELPNTESFNSTREFLFLAERDANVPKECFTTEQLKLAIHLGIQTHGGLLQTTSNAFQQKIMEIMKS